jgi:hypothetical protein
MGGDAARDNKKRGAVQKGAFLQCKRVSTRPPVFCGGAVQDEEPKSLANTGGSRRGGGGRGWGGERLTEERGGTNGRFECEERAAC